jgi:N-acetylglucosaminyl-diphospho-decaprenol L-rhamnosyltransferase
MAADKLQASAAPTDTAAVADETDAASVDVVVVSADMAGMTEACVAELGDPSVARVVVVDNAFDAAAGRSREALEESTSVVTLESPHGFAAANNRGVSAGSAPYILFINSDVLAEPGAIDSLLRAMRAHPEAVAAGGRLVDPETLDTQPGYRPRPFPSLANFLVILLGIEELWPGNPVTSRYHGSDLDDTSVQSVEQPAAAALMVARSELEAVGGFDERFWFWFEDSDLLLRLSRRGRVLYVPEAVFRHLGGGTFRTWSKSERIRSIHHGILHYGDAHFSRPQRLVLGAAAVAVSLPRVVLFRRLRPRQASAWRDIAAAGMALVRGEPVPAIAPGPGAEARRREQRELYRRERITRPQVR